MAAQQQHAAKRTEDASGKGQRIAERPSGARLGLRGVARTW
jgi:hypothetical protein